MNASDGCVTTCDALMQLRLSPMPRSLSRPQRVHLSGRVVLAVGHRGTVYTNAVTRRRTPFRFLDQWARESVVGLLCDAGLVTPEVRANYHAQCEMREHQQEARYWLHHKVDELGEFGVTLTKAQLAKLRKAAGEKR